MFGSFSQSSSMSRSSSETFVDRAQQPYLNFLRNRGMMQADAAMGQQSMLANLGRGLSQQGMGFLGNLQGIGSPEMQAAQMQQFAGQLGQQFQQQVLPGIRRGAMVSGMQGSGRQGVAEGVAAGQFGQALSSGFTDIMANAQMQRMQAAQTGLAGLGQVFGAAAAPMTAAYNPLMQFASILGAPTVLSESESKSRSSSMSMSGGIMPGGG